MDDQLVVVAAFNTSLEAELAKAKLAAEGIESVTRSDNLGGTFPSMQMATGGYQVLVLASHTDEATAILDDVDPAES